MSKTTFTEQEAAQIAAAYTAKRVGEIAKSLKELRERELKKAIVAPHKHTTGTTSSSGIEDIPPGKLNPTGSGDVLKSGKPEETTARGEETSMTKEELCKDCGKSHGMEKCMGKAMLKDAKGKTIDNGIVDGSTLPEDKKEKEVSADGSGGTIVKKAAMPPMAKPPSGKNMGTAVPTSKPGAMAKEVKQMIVHNSAPVAPPEGADFKSKKVGNTAVYNATPAPVKKPGVFGRLNKAEILIKKASVTQSIPTLKPAANGMHTVGGTATVSAPISQEKTGAGIAPSSLSAIGSGTTKTIPSLFKPKSSATPRAPVTIPLPKLTEAGKKLAPAMGDGPQGGTKTIAHVASNEPTKVARPMIMTPPGKVKL